MSDLEVFEIDVRSKRNLLNLKVKVVKYDGLDYYRDRYLNNIGTVVSGPTEGRFWCVEFGKYDSWMFSTGELEVIEND